MDESGIRPTICLSFSNFIPPLSEVEKKECVSNLGTDDLYKIINLGFLKKFESITQLRELNRPHLTLEEGLDIISNSVLNQTLDDIRNGLIEVIVLTSKSDNGTLCKQIQYYGHEQQNINDIQAILNKIINDTSMIFESTCYNLGKPLVRSYLR